MMKMGGEQCVFALHLWFLPMNSPNVIILDKLCHLDIYEEWIDEKVTKSGKEVAMQYDVDFMPHQDLSQASQS